MKLPLRFITLASVSALLALTGPAAADDDDSPPAGYVKASIISIAAEKRSVVTLDAGPAQGVFPGAKGYIVDKKGKSLGGDATFTLDEALSERMTVGDVGLSTDEINRTTKTVFVQVSSKRCTAPTTGALSPTAMKGAAAGAGWIGIDVPVAKPKWPVFPIDSGAKQGVYGSSQAWFIADGALLPADVKRAKASSATVTTTAQNPSAVKDKPLRLYVAVGKCS